MRITNLPADIRRHYRGRDVSKDGEVVSPARRSRVLSVRPRCAAVKVGRRVLSTFVTSLQLMMLLPDRHFSRRPLRGIVVGACLRTVPKLFQGSDIAGLELLVTEDSEYRCVPRPYGVVPWCQHDRDGSGLRAPFGIKS